MGIDMIVNGNFAPIQNNARAFTTTEPSSTQKGAINPADKLGDSLVQGVEHFHQTNFMELNHQKFYNFHLMLQTQIQALVITDIILCSISMNKTELS